MKFNLYLLLAPLIVTGNLFAQPFSPEVQPFIAVDTAVVAITNTTVIDGTGGEIRRNQTVLVKNDIIAGVGNEDEVRIPESALVIDGTGKTVIPGLVMLHEHLYYTKTFENWFDVGQMTFTFPRLYLAGGVTTMRTGGSIQPQTDLNVNRWIREGKMAGPKMHVTGPYIEREGYLIPSLNFIENAEEAARTVDYWADRGVTSFKVYNHITNRDLAAVLRAAHGLGLKVTGHLCSITYEEASDLGIDNLEHGFLVAADFLEDKKENACHAAEARKALAHLPVDDPEMDALIDVLIANNTAITSTPVVFEPYTGHEVVPGGGFEALAVPFQESVMEQYNRAVNNDSLQAALFDKNLRWLKRFYESGGLLVAGSDPTGAGRTVPGYANRRTVEIFVEAGFPLQDAVRICTLNGARYLEMDPEIGSIEAGKKADLLLIDGSLEEDIRNIRKTELVFKDGAGFDPEKLFESVKGKVGIY